MKKCITCKIELSKAMFHRDRTTKDGFYPRCKLCKKQYDSVRFCVNKSDLLRQNRQWRLNNPDYYKSYYLGNKEEILEYSKQWYSNNKQKKLETNKKYQNNKYKTNSNYRLVCNLRVRMNQVVKEFWKSGHTVELLGCTGKELMNYLEQMFYADMTRENYGKVWHVDHIKPCASFDLSKPEEQAKCFHYGNLQPLLAIDNIIKSDK